MEHHEAVGPVLAALDLGTNSIHMVIVQIYRDPAHFSVLTRAKEMVRLGETCPQTGWLTPVAMERAITALGRFKELATSYEVTDIVAVATSAVREAPNGPEFLQQIRRMVGLPVDLISGKEEARRIYLGVLSALDFHHQSHVVFDIGGGSTEFILGNGEEPQFLSSVKVGAVRLTQDFIHSDPISKPDYEKLQHHIRLRLEPVISELRAVGRYVGVVGCSGTIEALASLDQGLQTTTVLQGYVLEQSRLKELVQQLRLMTVAQRRKLPGVPERRADVILAGAMILLETMLLLDCERLTVCGSALREGLVVDWMAERGMIASYIRYQSSMRERAVQLLAQRYQVDWPHVSHVANFALTLFDQARQLGLHTWEDGVRQLLWAAAILHNVGHFVSHSAHHKHSYYLIRHSGLLGYTEEEIELIANLARYHRNSPPKRRHEVWEHLSKEQRLLVSQVSAILRLATALDRRRQQVIQAVHLTRTSDQGLTLTLCPRDTNEDCALEVWNLDAKKDVFEAEFNQALLITVAVETAHPILVGV